MPVKTFASLVTKLLVFVSFRFFCVCVLSLTASQRNFDSTCAIPIYKCISKYKYIRHVPLWMHEQFIDRRKKDTNEIFSSIANQLVVESRNDAMRIRDASKCYKIHLSHHRHGRINKIERFAFYLFIYLLQWKKDKNTYSFFSGVLTSDMRFLGTHTLHLCMRHERV